MKVIGLASTTFSPPIMPLASIARARRSFHFQPILLASLSSTRKPILWRVRSYSAPGLPSPITSFIAPHLTSVGQAHCQELRQSGIDNLFLRRLVVVGDAIELEAAFGIIDHERGARVAIARLTDAAWIDDGAVIRRRLPITDR